MDNIILIGIIVGCVVFIAVCILKRRPDLIVDLVLRAIVGTAAVYLLDLVLHSQGYEISVGINGATALVNGLLGLPGFLLLYGLAVYYSFQ